MSHAWRVIGKVYNRITGDFYGNIIGLSGGIVTVEVTDDSGTDEFEYPINMLRKNSRIDWESITPVGSVYNGEL